MEEIFTKNIFRRFAANACKREEIILMLNMLKQDTAIRWLDEVMQEETDQGAFPPKPLSAKAFTVLHPKLEAKMIARLFSGLSRNNLNDDSILKVRVLKADLNPGSVE